MKIAPQIRWIEPDTAKSIPLDLIDRLGGNELLARALVNRGVTGWEQAQSFLDPDHYHPADPFDLPDMDKTVVRLQTALKKQECIGVWGDFDVDGQTATSLLVGVLQGLGAKVIYHIPVRAQESHGVNLPGLKRFLEAGAELVLTCDTGITAHEAADFCRQQGIDLLITDHHSLPEQLPNAFSVVNPQRLPKSHPLRTLAGVGVAYQVAAALSERENRPELARQQLDLVALGCVADVAGLTGDVRYLVQRGLAQLRDPQRIGLRALYERAEITPATLTEQQIGFVIAPRLNAIGRLSDANPVVDFLTTGDQTSASVFAARLEGLNSERRFITDQVFQAALSMLERDPNLLHQPALILAHPEWPAGVVGIVASRLVELYNKPTILLSSPPGEPARGSARSIEGVHITAAIAAGADLLLGYGGHPMAAGMSLEPQHLPEFRQRVWSAVRQQTAGRDLTPTLSVDAFVQLTDLNLDVVGSLESLAPFGAGNPPIVLAVRSVIAVDVAAIGKTGEHLQIIIEDEGGNSRRVLWWQGVREWIPDGKFDLAFTARTTDYRGSVEVQLEWVNARAIDGEDIGTLWKPTKIKALDFRNSLDPQQELETLVIDRDCVIWREGLQQDDPKGLLRDHLIPAEVLVIWDIPPGRAEISQAVDKVKPAAVALFANDAGKDDPQSFLLNLGGMVRHALRTRSGEVSLDHLAGLLNQRAVTVQTGIRWMAARGYVRVTASNSGQLTLAEGGDPQPAAVPELEQRLEALLEETRAFRKYYRRANPTELLTV